MGNAFKTAILLGLLTALIIFIGGYLGGQQGMLIALVFAGVMNFGSYWFSDKIVLAMYRAKEVREADAPGLHSIVTRIAARANAPKPRIYIIPQDAPNAFATGRNPEHAAVAVTHGIMKLLDDEELEGVIAHEMAHVKNRDILIGSIAATMAGAIMFLANMARFAAIFGGYGGRDREEGGNAFSLLLTAIIAPIAALFIQMAISRSREYHADATGTQFTGNPNGLARALEKLGKYSGRIPLEANPATNHMLIVRPFSGGTFLNLFSTHPPIEERIRRLLGR